MTLNLVPQIIEYETGFILSYSQNYSNFFELQVRKECFLIVMPIIILL
jgi:hypothetical protein